MISGNGCQNNATYGLSCSDDQPTEFNCILNVDFQNETTYSCRACNSSMDFSSNSSLCGTRFQLNMVTLIFETAAKNLWLKLPFAAFCEWDTLFCYGDLNRTLYIDVNDSASMNSSVDTFQCNWVYGNGSADVISPKARYGWSFLFVILFIIAGGVGNILVCLAVCLDKRLQNVTNYFLLSLAIADLLVSLFVMPMGAIPGFLGELLLNLLENY